jgi:hypothetical protein
MVEPGQTRNWSRQPGVSPELLRHIGNIFRFSSSDFGQSLLSDLGLTIGRNGDNRLARVVSHGEV